ncbi:hypothetical protein [Halosimplex pelagicum]|uniref:Uncharacterized protein n=1 Tax=Halosimplex pelagicum TaxID=869886 RepID=A0A7D5STH6_9EURY|nr:hypothetical protein [Halosimplex pelagicum]QLH80447.1 hypothetical protein HZS54_01840 [Halosimplex pelagicum]
MEYRTRLAANLASESEAYGYTLTIWGSGALLIHAYSVPGVARILSFVAGALAGFALLAAVAFEGFSTQMTVEESPSSLVVSAVHVLSTGGALAVVSLVLDLTPDGWPLVTFFVVGALATTAYNALLLLEAVAVRAVT